MNANLDRIVKLVNPANTIGVNRFLAHALGAAEAAIFAALLAKSAYYEEHGMCRDGWFYSTAADLEESTAYTWRKQSPAIEKLATAGLIRYELRGMPAKRYFKLGEAEALENALALGEQIVSEKFGEEKKHTRENCEASINKTSKQESTNCQSMLQQNVDVYKTKEKTKETNPKIKSSIAVGDFDDLDDDIREKSLSEFKKNVCYDELCVERPNELEHINSLLQTMADAVCSDKKTLRVNGADMPRGKVAEAYYRLKKEHIIAALNSIGTNPKPVHNARGYLVTVLYNSLNKISAQTPFPKPAKPANSRIDTDRLRAAVMAWYKKGERN